MYCTSKFLFAPISYLIGTFYLPRCSFSPSGLLLRAQSYRLATQHYRLEENHSNKAPKYIRHILDKKSFCIVKVFSKFPSYRPCPFKSVVVFQVSPRFAIRQASPGQTSAMKCIFGLINESHTDFSHVFSPKHSCLLVHC